MSFKSLPLVLALAASGFVSQAQAASALSFSGWFMESAGVSATPLFLSTDGGSRTSTSSWDGFVARPTDIRTETVIEVAPTATSTGVAIDYQITEKGYDTQRTTETSTYDFYNLSVSAASPALAGSKYITLTGTVTATEATQMYFSLSGVGTFVPVVSMFGPSSPGAISFFEKAGSAAYSPLASSLYTTPAGDGASSYSAYSGSSWVSVAAGSNTFSLVIAAPDAMSISNFDVSLLSLTYDTHTQTALVADTFVQTYYSKTVVGSHVLAAVPEPETYAMLLCGLGLMGAVIRRRRAK